MEYERHTLERLWQVEMGIFCELARICDKYHLVYMASYGTALGAARHGGFIPWDDDMDFIMPRKDYETLIRVAPAELSKNYELLEIRLTPHYTIPFAKLTRSDTTFVEEAHQHRRYHSGIFIDIYPLDEAWEDIPRQRKLLNRCWFLARLFSLRENPFPHLPKDTRALKKLLIRVIGFSAHWGLRLTGQTVSKLYRRYLDLVTLPAREGGRDLWNDVAEYRFEQSCHPDGIFLPGRILFPAGKADFAGSSMSMPADVHAYLTMVYGDYMVLPPPEKRHAHCPAELDFGEGVSP